MFASIRCGTRHWKGIIEFATQSDKAELIQRVVRIQVKQNPTLLTKRSARMRKYFSSCRREAPGNVWLGVSVENRQYGLQRVDDLREIKAGIRFLSIEPLLDDIGEIDLRGIHWVIVGGESDPRPGR